VFYICFHRRHVESINANNVRIKSLNRPQLLLPTVDNHYNTYSVSSFGLCTRSNKHKTQQHTNTQTHQHTSTTQTQIHTNTAPHKYNNTQTHQHTNTPTHKHNKTQQHTNTTIHKHTNTQTYQQSRIRKKRKISLSHIIDLDFHEFL
jgi:hypothetical protein